MSMPCKTTKFKINPKEIALYDLHKVARQQPVKLSNLVVSRLQIWSLKDLRPGGMSYIT